MSHLTYHLWRSWMIYFGFRDSKIARGGSIWFNFAHSYLKRLSARRRVRLWCLFGLGSGALVLNKCALELSQGYTCSSFTLLLRNSKTNKSYSIRTEIVVWAIS